MAQLIIGLGNPGGEYARTRHNVGWMCLDELERRGKFGRERREGAARVREGTIDGYDVITARPQTFMNLSGKAAAQLTSKHGTPPGDVIVVHDEADFPLGRVSPPVSRANPSTRRSVLVQRLAANIAWNLRHRSRSLSRKPGPD